MPLTETLTDELKNYLEIADPVLMNDVLMLALTKLYPQLDDKEIAEFSHCHKLLSALCKQKQPV